MYNLEFFFFKLATAIHKNITYETYAKYGGGYFINY